MNEFDAQDSAPSSPGRRRPTGLIVVVTLLFIECLLVAGAAAYLLVELLIDTPTSLPSAIFILGLTLLAAVVVGLVTVRMFAGEPWTRGAAVVWQVLQASVGVGSLQGMYARPEVGWPLIGLALVVLVLLFTKPVLDATSRRDEEQLGDAG